MKTLLIIVISFSTSCFGQTYKKFEDFSFSELNKNKGELKEYYNSFLALISKRDTAYLRKQLTETKAIEIYLVEGYHFATNKYSLFEEYKLDSNVFQTTWSSSKFLLDRQPVKIYGNYFLNDSVHLKLDSSTMDTIYPRKYRHGAGCVIANKTKRIFKKLKKKAKNDGIVIEQYCRIETRIDNITQHVSIKYFFPVKGRRETYLAAGMLSDWPEGLDFWLFASPHFVDGD